MAGKEENRIFVGGLSSDVSERQLHRAFDRYGKILECQNWERFSSIVRNAAPEKGISLTCEHLMETRIPRRLV